MTRRPHLASASCPPGCRKLPGQPRSRTSMPTSKSAGITVPLIPQCKPSVGEWWRVVLAADLRSPKSHLFDKQTARRPFQSARAPCSCRGLSDRAVIVRSLHAALPPWLPVMPRKGLSNGSWPVSPSRWICLSTSRAAAASVKAREPIEQEPLLRVVLGQPVADHRHRDLVGNQVRPGRGNPGPQAGTADHIRHAGGGEPAMRRAEPHEHRWALAEGRRVRAMTTIPGSCSSSAENSPAAQRHAAGGARFWCATG